MVDIAVHVLGEDDLIRIRGISLNAPLRMVDAPVVAVDPDLGGHTPRVIEDDEDVGLNGLGDEGRCLALHAEGRNGPKHQT